MRSILVGELSYYKMTLKVGVDCRDSGLGWVLRKLKELGNVNGKSDNSIKEQNHVNPSSSYK